MIGGLRPQRWHLRHAHVLPAMPELQSCAAGDPSPKEQIEAESSDDEDAEITSNDELMVAVAAVRVGY